MFLNRLRNVFTKPKVPPGQAIAGLPPIEALALFYAELGEPADLASLEKRYEISEKAGLKESVLHHCDPDPHNPTRVIAMARAWATPDKAKGIVSEINVTSDYRGSRIGKDLLKDISAQTFMRGNSAKTSATLDRELGVVRTVYAICISLGFRDMTHSVYQLWFGDRASVPLDEKALLTSLAGAVALIGIRMFWGTGNIRRFVHRRVFELKIPKRPSIIGHVLLLLFHAFLFFLICDTFSAIDCLRNPLVWQDAHFPLLCMALLFLNSVWLLVLKRKRTDHGPEELWLINNLACFLLLLVGLVGCVHFKAQINMCLSVVCFVLVVNSAIDLIFTRDVYILSGASGGG